MSDDIPLDDEVADDEIPVVSEDGETYEVTDEGEVEEILDPLQEAIQRAEKAEKEIAYKEAETQNVRKRMLTEKSDAIKYGGMGMARRMLTILADVDRALSALSDDDETATKLELAYAYQKMGDREGATEILQEVIKEGSEEQAEEASKLLGSLDGKSD